MSATSGEQRNAGKGISEDAEHEATQPPSCYGTSGLLEVEATILGEGRIK